jgi:transcriptional regulator with XRE-family HTH domain
VSLAKNIVRARQKAGLSQADLAKKVKKSRSSVNEYESGNHTPKLKLLIKIAKATGTTVEALLA